MSLKESITSLDIKKIFRNKITKFNYLNELYEEIQLDKAIFVGSQQLDEQIIDTWNYEISKKVIRQLFKNTDKYKYIQGCKNTIDEAINDWKELKLGDFEWPFRAMNFDQYVHRLNRRTDITEIEKDDLLCKDIIKFRRIKNINALRNDYIEYLIFQNDNVIPTFGNVSGIDFYIDGNPFDQKVAKSVGNDFINMYGENYRQIAIDNPNLVAVSMYQNQDEERFGDEPRLLIVYLDSDVSSKQIESQLSSINFSQPIQISFDYRHKDGIRTHNTNCFVVLLHN